jgi:superfamily II DNA or RNA helicase
MMKILVEPGFVWVSGDKAVLDILYQRFSFHNKQAENELKRFLRICAAKENAGRGGPGWDAWKQKTLQELKLKTIVYAGKWAKDTLVFPVGLLHAIKEALLDYQVQFHVEDKRNWEFTRRLLGRPQKMRPYQEEALKIAIESKTGMLRCATGTGKTVLGQELIRHFGFKSLFLVPSRPILEQTVRRFRESFGKKNVGVFGGDKKDPGWVTVATYQSIYASDEDWSEYSLIVADEVHHVAAETFFSVMTKKLYHAPYVFGLTADEERADGGTILVEAASGPVLFSYDAPQAIADGHLAKPTFIIYEVTDTSGTYRTTEIDPQSGEDIIVEKESRPTETDKYMEATKNWLIGNDLLHSKIAQMAQGFAESGDSVLILVDEKEQGEKLIRNLSGAEFITGGGKSNEKTIKAFNNRQLKILVATSVLGEGADTVPVNVLINLMGGTRPKQANGRALRNDPDPETGIPRKPTALIIDFDFPKSSILSRHSELRQAVHKECGEVHRVKFI